MVDFRIFQADLLAISTKQRKIGRGLNIRNKKDEENLCKNFKIFGVNLRGYIRNQS